jgi:hypothetical protein
MVIAEEFIIGIHYLLETNECKETLFSLVIILVTTGELVRHILLEAHELGMGNGEYAFFGVELVKSTGNYGDFSWYQPGDKRNKQAREIYESLMMVAVRVPTSPEYISFTHKVTQMSLDEFGGTTTIDNVSKSFFELKKK